MSDSCCSIHDGRTCVADMELEEAEFGDLPELLSNIKQRKGPRTADAGPRCRAGRRHTLAMVG